MKVSPSLSVASVVLPGWAACGETNVRPGPTRAGYPWSVKRIGSPTARGVLAVRSGFFSQKAFAGDEQSSNVTRNISARNPPKYVVVPPFGIGPLLLAKVWPEPGRTTFSVSQFTPIDGSPASSP